MAGPMMFSAWALSVQAWLPRLSSQEEGGGYPALLSPARHDIRKVKYDIEFRLNLFGVKLTISDSGHHSGSEILRKLGLTIKKR